MATGDLGESRLEAQERAVDTALLRDPLKVTWLAIGCLVIPIGAADLVTEVVVYNQVFADRVVRHVQQSVPAGGPVLGACLKRRTQRQLRETYPAWLTSAVSGSMDRFAADMMRDAVDYCNVAQRQEQP